MKNIPEWIEIDRDIRIGMVLMAESVHALLGRFDSDRAKAAAAAILGFDDPEDADHLLGDRVWNSFDKVFDHDFLSKVRVEETSFWNAAKCCHDDLVSGEPINRIDLDTLRDENLFVLEYMLSVIPGEQWGANDFTYLFKGEDSSLRKLAEHTKALVSLAEEIESAASAHRDFWTGFYGFTPQQIAILGDLNLRSARNAIGVGGDKPIRSSQKGENDFSPGHTVGNFLDAVEWLAGRRGFEPGILEPEWVNGQLDSITSIAALAAMPGLVAWLGKTTSQDIADRAGWEVERVRKWFRAEGLDVHDAKVIAAAAGLDPKRYSARMADLLA